MESPLSTRALLLLILNEGPSYGRDLARALVERSQGRIVAGPGSIYPALSSLVAGGHVRRWEVIPGRQRGGRSRTYYELTPRGIRKASADRRAIAALLAGPERPPSSADVILMRERIRQGVALSDFGFRLRQGVLASRGGR
jgi:DNA-binding PadR family transcriptional regulator